MLTKFRASLINLFSIISCILTQNGLSLAIKVSSDIGKIEGSLSNIGFRFEKTKKKKTKFLIKIDYKAIQ